MPRCALSAVRMIAGAALAAPFCSAALEEDALVVEAGEEEAEVEAAKAGAEADGGSAIASSQFRSCRPARSAAAPDADPPSLAPLQSTHMQSQPKLSDGVMKRQTYINSSKSSINTTAGDSVTARRKVRLSTSSSSLAGAITEDALSAAPAAEAAASAASRLLSSAPTKTNKRAMSAQKSVQTCKMIRQNRPAIKEVSTSSADTYSTVTPGAAEAERRAAALW